MVMKALRLQTNMFSSMRMRDLSLVSENILGPRYPTKSNSASLCWVSSTLGLGALKALLRNAIRTINPQPLQRLAAAAAAELLRSHVQPVCKCPHRRHARQGSCPGSSPGTHQSGFAYFSMQASEVVAADSLKSVVSTCAVDLQTVKPTSSPVPGGSPAETLEWFAASPRRKVKEKKLPSHVRLAAPQGLQPMKSSGSRDFQARVLEVVAIAFLSTKIR